MAPMDLVKQIRALALQCLQKFSGTSQHRFELFDVDCESVNSLRTLEQINDLMIEEKAAR